MLFLSPAQEKLVRRYHAGAARIRSAVGPGKTVVAWQPAAVPVRRCAARADSRDHVQQVAVSPREGPIPALAGHAGTTSTSSTSTVWRRESSATVQRSVSHSLINRSTGPTTKPSCVPWALHPRQALSHGQLGRIRPLPEPDHDPAGRGVLCSNDMKQAPLASTSLSVSSAW